MLEPLERGGLHEVRFGSRQFCCEDSEVVPLPESAHPLPNSDQAISQAKQSRFVSLLLLFFFSSLDAEIELSSSFPSLIIIYLS